MRIESPWILIAAPLLILFIIWLGRRSYAQLEPWARRGSNAVRVLVVLLLLAALARPDYLQRNDHSQLLLLLDVSRSVTKENLEAAIERIDALAAAQVARGSGHSATLIAFGRGAETLIGPVNEWKGVDEISKLRILYQTSLHDLRAEHARMVSAGANEKELKELSDRISAVELFRDDIAGESTDVERAARLALNTAAGDEAKLVYIFTDGNFNRGDLDDLMAGDNGTVEWHFVSLNRPGPPETAAASLELPQRVRVNETFTAVIDVVSSSETNAEIAVSADGIIVNRIQASLQPGTNSIEIPGLYFRDKGFHAVEAVVRADDDTKLENNTIRSLLIVPGEARVLYVEADESQSLYLKSALETEGMRVEVRPELGIPNSLSDLLSFDVFIVSNVPADKMSLRQMEMIESYVRDFGGGFIMLGGEDSFGLGGYFNTPVEDVLPVRMPIQKDLLRPSLALVLVIDKSGSMSGPKIELAKRAAIATADAINPRDEIGVIGFDSASQVILELTPAGDRATIASHIASLDASGGTFLYPALEEARNRLQQSAARKKHVIILSDGQTEGSGYQDMAMLMSLEGTTISTVGIGDGADMDLMEKIAMSGGGRSYFTDDFQSIPQIFTREALRASKNMLIERLVTPIIVEYDPALAEIEDEELPLLSGYVATTVKPTAHLLIVSDSGDPILAKWRNGLGTAAAYTSDTKTRWAEDWIRWPSFAKFWAQLVRSVAGSEIGENLSVDIEHRRVNDTLLFEADVRDASAGFVDDIEVRLTSFNERDRIDVPVERTGPGMFEAKMNAPPYGVDQQLAWQILSPDQEPRTVAYGLVESFSPEFRTLQANESEFRRLAEFRDASITDVENVALSESSMRSGRWIELWPWLLTAAVLLAPLDILLRRIG